MNVNIIYQHFRLKKKTALTKYEFFYQDTLYYVDSIGRQTIFAIDIPCDVDPANIIALNPDGNGSFSLTPAPLKQDNPANFKPSQNRSTIQPNTISAHTAGLL